MCSTIELRFSSCQLLIFWAIQVAEVAIATATFFPRKNVAIETVTLFSEKNVAIAIFLPEGKNSIAFQVYN